MEMRPGYKRTEIGVIPQNWEVVCLGDKTTKVGSGITPTGGERVYKQEGRPFLRSQNVGWGSLLLDDVAHIDEATHETFSATEVKAGDVFLNITGASIGRSAVADSRVIGGNVNQHVCIIRVDQGQVDPRFLNRVLLSEVGQRQIDSFQAGGNRQGLNFGQICSFRVPTPPFLEQHAIADALSDVDALLLKLDQLVAKKRDLKQGAVQELIHGRRRLPGFGGKWTQQQLGTCALFLKGKGLSKSDLVEHGREPCIHYGELFTHYPETISVIKSRTDWQEGAFRSEANDVLMPTSDVTPTGLARASCIPRSDVILGGDILVIRASRSVLYGSFLSYLIRSSKPQILQRVTGTTVFHLYGANLADFTFQMPPTVEEQEAIVRVLDNMDAEIAALEARRDKMRAIKQGMMQELLTGKIRLV